MAPDAELLTFIGRLVHHLGCSSVHALGETGRRVADALGPLNGTGAILVVAGAGSTAAVLDGAAPAAVVVLDGGDDAPPGWAEAGFVTAWRGTLDATELVVLAPPEGGERVLALLQAGPRSLMLDPSADAAGADLARLDHMRVGILTYEFHGVTANGGIGTAYTGLAEALSEAGADVDVLATGFHGYWNGVVDEEPAETKEERGAHARLRVHRLDAEGSREVLAPYWDVRRAYAAYRWLREQHEQWPFDVIHVPESRGHGAFVINAKRSGLAFAGVTIVVGVHSPMLWQHEGNLLPFDSYESLVADHLERTCLRGADVLVAPSAYMFHYLRAREYETTAPCFVQQNIAPRKHDEGAAEELPAPDGLTELVFFGRLETRKGLDAFLDAVELLAERDRRRAVKITFLGRPGVEDEPPEEFIARRAADWPWEVSVLTNLDQPQALAYLRSRRCVPVMPSRVENSPMTVLEALELGRPFLAADNGGTAELVDPRHHDAVIVPWYPPGRLAPVGFDEVDTPPPVEALADAMVRALDGPGTGARFAVPPEANRAAHVAWHAGIAARKPVPPVPDVDDAPVRITVLALGDRPPRVPGASSVAVGSRTLAEALAAISTSHVLLLGADHGLLPRALEQLEAAVRRTGAPVISFPALAGGAERWMVPAGGPALNGALHDVFSAGSVLVRRDVVLDTDVPTDAPSDVALHALLAALALRGHLPFVLPDALVVSRRPIDDAELSSALSLVDAVTLSPDLRRSRFVLRAYRAALPPGLRDMPGALRAMTERLGASAMARRRAEERLHELDEMYREAMKRVWALDDMRKEAEAMLERREEELAHRNGHAGGPRVAQLELELAEAHHRFAALRRRRIVRVALRLARPVERLRR